MEYVYSAQNVQRVNINDVVLNGADDNDRNTVRELLTFNGKEYQRSKNVRFDNCLHVHRLPDGSLSKESIIISTSRGSSLTGNSHSMEDVVRDYVINTLVDRGIDNGIIVTCDNDEDNNAEFWEPYKAQDEKDISDPPLVLSLSEGAENNMVTVPSIEFIYSTMNK